ncbi:unnamed protein product [Gongylonema pulchrum]|uniref:TrmE_N domain-containing protein n=1 Tax=Gongylonema pulchrum TaxID=637853 RepID=A0A183EA17_9BILA|nr:unnamed protein product [Gongylonema pulchrum]
MLKLIVRSCSIFALSSGALPSAIAIVRVSGRESRRCLEELSGRKDFEPRQLFFAKLRYKGELIDRAMAVFLPGPRTSTGEDVAEFYVHGSRAVVDCLSDALSQFSNVRHAKAGEFTKRAFYNGKLTLSEVQSLSHLLAAQTQRQRRLALRTNTLGKVMEKVRNQLVEVRASIEASIDFGDDVDFDWVGIRSAISAVIEKLKNIQQRVHRGTVITDGVQIVILGETNVGKSSLFNRIGISRFFQPFSSCSMEVPNF